MKKNLIIAVLFIVCLNSLTVYADFKVDNNGTTRKDPYGSKSSISSSYIDVEYYDCAIPYKKTCDEIGGICLSDMYDAETGTTYSKMADVYKKLLIGDKVNYQGQHGGPYTKGYPTRIKSYEIETDTGCDIYVDKNGNKYYIMALQKFFWEYSGAWYGWSLENRLQCVDVMLTNGYVIHFVIGDCNSSAHTNGSTDTSSAGSWEASKLNYPQYRYLFQAMAGNTLEIWGKDLSCANKFMQKYGMKLDGSGAHIMYIRMYHCLLDDAPTRTRKAGKAQAYSLTGKAIVTDTSSDEGSVSNDSEKEGETDKSSDVDLINSVRDEKDITGMGGLLDKMSDDAEEINLPTRNSLSIDEQKNISKISDKSSTNSIEAIWDWLRVVVVWLGVMLLTYIPILIISYIFDKVNTILSISLLSVVTIGRIEGLTGDEEDDHEILKDILRICLLCFIVAVFLISGGVYGLIARVISFLREF